jgi:uncharacterized protein (TIGR02246 family)
MPRVTYLLVSLAFFGLVPGAWAQADREKAEVDRAVVQIQQQWVQGFEGGNVEALSELYAEDAHLTPPTVPFRVEGRQAIKEAWGGFMRVFSQRQIFFTHPVTRLFAGNQIALSGGYCFASLLDMKGNPVTDFMRNSITFVKVRDRWLIADHHMSNIPGLKMTGAKH